MNENFLRTVLAVFGALVGAVSMFFTQVGRIEARVEREVTLRVKQAVLERDLERQREQWWLQEGKLAGLEGEIDALRVDMAKGGKE